MHPALGAVRSAAGLALRSTLMRPGAVRTIRRGPSRGLRYRVYPGYGVSPIYGGWEPELQRALKRYIHPGWTVYDVGANYGIHTVLMARLVGPAGHVYAFEPAGDLCTCVTDNVSLNGLANVTAVHLAVDAVTGTQDFVISASAATGHFAGPDSSSGDSVVTVQTSSLDDLVFVQGWAIPDLVKIDVEGAESRVLTGARRILEARKPTLLIELHTPDQDVAVGATLRDLGYRVFRLETGQPVLRLDKSWPHPDGVWGQIIAVG